MKTIKIPDITLPEELKLALLVVGAIVLYALHKVGGGAVTLASNAVAGIVGWMARGKVADLVAKAAVAVSPPDPLALAATPAAPVEPEA